MNLKKRISLMFFACHRATRQSFHSLNNLDQKPSLYWLCHTLKSYFFHDHFSSKKISSLTLHIYKNFFSEPHRISEKLRFRPYERSEGLLERFILLEECGLIAAPRGALLTKQNLFFFVNTFTDPKVGRHSSPKVSILSLRFHYCTSLCLFFTSSPP